MDSSIVETTYPLSFRKKDATIVGQHLEQQKSVELIGMKRVGINNFLRFFLFHKGIKEQYMPQDGKHFFILIDLNDLIERELFPFWRLAFKRIADAVDASSFNEIIKKKIAGLFLASIQSGDLFLTYDGVREALSLLAKENIYPTLFFTRFDRLIEAVTPEFFNNLQSLKDATSHKLTYVFTSFRDLDSLMPDVFHRKDLSLFSHVVYMQPSTQEDSKVILETMRKHYKLELSKDLVEKIVFLSGGHVQYLQLSSLILSEIKESTEPENLEKLLLSDERINLQSEELWESLTEDEKRVLLKVINEEKIESQEKEKAKYLWDTGILPLFSPLFEVYLRKFQKKEPEQNSIEFSKKEHMLFKYLEEHVNDICEREDIVDIVWPEYKEYGVSDWSIDRLVARVRSKLKKQKSPYEIVTIRTRGYKLIIK